eukprot:scaffold3145_cov101-Isochrysis_galbana.AAC.2
MQLKRQNAHPLFRDADAIGATLEAEAALQVAAITHIGDTAVGGARKQLAPALAGLAPTTMSCSHGSRVGPRVRAQVRETLIVNARRMRCGLRHSKCEGKLRTNCRMTDRRGQDVHPSCHVHPDAPRQRSPVP